MPLLTCPGICIRIHYSEFLPGICTPAFLLSPWAKRTESNAKMSLRVSINLERQTKRCWSQERFSVRLIHAHFPVTVCRIEITDIPYPTAHPDYGTEARFRSLRPTEQRVLRVSRCETTEEKKETWRNVWRNCSSVFHPCRPTYCCKTANAEWEF